MTRPAIRIVLAPLQREAPKGRVLMGTAQGRTIRLDPRQPCIVKTYLHEKLHVEHPSWSETRVRREAASRWKRMTWRQKAMLTRELAHAVIVEAE